jgi:hypothetical protein
LNGGIAVISKFAAMPFLIALLAHLGGGEKLSTTSAGRRYRGRVSTLDPFETIATDCFTAIDFGKNNLFQVDCGQRKCITLIAIPISEAR